jgi:hypothetical protein
MAVTSEPDVSVYYKRVDNIPLSKSTKNVTLVSNDGQKFTLPVPAALLSKFLRRTLYADAGINIDEDDGNDEEDSWWKFGSKKLDKIVQTDSAEEVAEEVVVEEPDQYQDIPVVKASGVALEKIVEFLNHYHETERLHKIRDSLVSFSRCVSRTILSFSLTCKCLL